MLLQSYLVSLSLDCIRCECRADVPLKVNSIGLCPHCKQDKLDDFPRSRPALSLLAYCCYHNGDYARAAEFYEELVTLYPESEEYKVYYVQSLVKAGSYLDATRVAASTAVASSSYSQRMRLLQAHAELEQGMLSACKTTLSQCLEDDPETILSLAAVDFRERKFANALEKYRIAKQVMGNQPAISYYIALCHYEMGEYDVAMKDVDEIIDRMRMEQNESRDFTLGRSKIKHSFVVEAFNLKAAICYDTKLFDAAKNVMKELCELRNNGNLDSVVIHNDAIIHNEDDPSVGMQKLSYLLSDTPFPPETLGNLISLYTIHGHDDLAAETFEANKALAKELLLPELYAYLDAAIMSLSCPNDAFSMLETLAAQHAAKLRSGMKSLSDAVNSTSIKDNGAQSLTAATKEFDNLLDRYIPILMLQAKLYWDKKEYDKAEQLLGRNAEICREHDAWRLNMGHVLFAQQKDKFQASIRYYELIVENRTEHDLLKVPSAALANLCVAYIMANQNDAAEDIMRTIEIEEAQQIALGSSEKTYHSCIINLVIGTLYCEKGNFEFGISRITKSLEPFDKNLCPDTWFYTKRCILALASKLSKLMCMINDDTFQEIMYFLDDVESNGRHIVADRTENLDDPSYGLLPTEPATIASEARQMKHIFVKLCT